MRPSLKDTLFFIQSISKTFASKEHREFSLKQGELSAKNTNKNQNEDNRSIDLETINLTFLGEKAVFLCHIVLDFGLRINSDLGLILVVNVGVSSKSLFV